MIAKIRVDAANDPHSDGPTGGAGASSQMDDVQLGRVVHQLSQNLDRIADLLGDGRAFPSNADSDEQRALLLVKQRLQSVVDEQRRTLNILSMTVDSNEAMDLASRCDPIDPIGCRNGGTAPVRFGSPSSLETQVEEEQNAETLVAPAVVAVIDMCKRKSSE